MEEPPSGQDVRVGDQQLAAGELEAQRHRLAAAAARVHVGEPEGLVALVAHHPLGLMAEAALALGADLGGVEGGLHLPGGVATDEEPDLLVGGIEEVVEPNLLRPETGKADPYRAVRPGANALVSGPAEAPVERQVGHHHGTREDYHGEHSMYRLESHDQVL